MQITYLFKQGHNILSLRISKYLKEYLLRCKEVNVRIELFKDLAMLLKMESIGDSLK